MTEPTPFDPKPLLRTLPHRAGIYQMYDGQGQVLYVGKAKNLKRRVSSYFQKSALPPKTAALVKRVRDVQVTVAASETEALILEQSLIKHHRPPFNILLRDDKSYPYIFVSDATYPRLGFHRGAKRAKGRYFGPFPNSGAVRESLNFLQKVFRVRQCEDSFFRNRSRPCLQYQINRCTAPCVDFISPEAYAEDVRHTVMFLEGQNETVIQELADEMERAAEQLDFERAATLRDQIADLRAVQSQQVAESGDSDVDVIAVAQRPGGSCVHVLYIRQGRILGSKSYFPGETVANAPSDILEAFVAQFYLASAHREIPRQVILSHPVDGEAALAEALKQRSGRTVSLSHRVRGHRAKWQQLALTTAEQNLAGQLANHAQLAARFEALQDALGLAQTPQRLECFDISHSAGESTVASCVVFETQGPVKSDYRRFNIDDITPGDDYAAMKQALTRRYTRLQKGEGKVPDILLIDGGKGQLAQAEAVMTELGVSDLLLVGVAKGPSRRPGLELLYLPQRTQPLELGPDSPALHLIQQVRDEAHRFAITGHKQRRDKRRSRSVLEDIPGVGPKRRRELLRHFGGLQELKRASMGEIAGAPGISKALAEIIYSTLHSE